MPLSNWCLWLDFSCIWIKICIVFNLIYESLWAFLMIQQVKNLPSMKETQEMRVQCLGQEDPSKEEMATHSSILAWKIPWTEKPGGLQSVGSQRVGHDWSDLACSMCWFLWGEKKNVGNKCSILEQWNYDTALGQTSQPLSKWYKSP